MEEPPFRPEFFARLTEEPDEAFYTMPRKVVRIDDAVLLTVSIQYITQPITIFREVWRILRPGTPFVVIFSNRMFPMKAVAIWRMLDDQKHIDLVASYFHYAGNFVGVEAHNWSPST